MRPVIAGLLAGLAVVGAGLAWCSNDLRWRPHPLVRDESEIAEALDRSGWVSPGLSRTRVLWMISYRTCAECLRFENEAFRALNDAGVDTRVIMTPQPEGAMAAERTTVAALWATRDWNLYRRWSSAPTSTWAATGLPSADLDPQRAAELQKAQGFVESLSPWLKQNGLQPRYPILVWRDPRGRLRGCDCDPRSFHQVLAELGVPHLQSGGGGPPKVVEGASSAHGL